LLGSPDPKNQFLLAGMIMAVCDFQINVDPKTNIAVGAFKLATPDKTKDN